MRYIQPYGSTDLDGPYVNGNPAAGIRGSIPPAEMVEHPLRELSSLIRNSNYFPNYASVQQLTEATRSQRLNFGVDVGSENAIVVNYIPAFTTLTVGLPLHVFIANNNTDSATILVDGIGPVFIIRANGASLAPDDLKAGAVACLVYDGAYFQLQNYLGYATDQLNNYYYQAKIPYCADTSSTANTVQAPFNPAITSLEEGLLIEVKIANQNTGATIIQVNSLSSKPIRIPSVEGFQELSSGQLTVGLVVFLVYDGVQFQLVNGPASNRLTIIDTVRLVKRYTYQSPNMMRIGPGSEGDLRIFECNYTPVAAGNRLRIQVTGAIGYDSTTCPSVAVYLAYKTSNRPNWSPPQFPGADFPAQSPPYLSEPSLGRGPVAGLMANTAQLGFVYQATDPWSIQVNNLGLVLGVWERFARNFVICGQLPVPEGPPGTITLGLWFRPKAAEEVAAYVPGGDGLRQPIYHTAYGGIMLQVYEYSR